MLNQDRLNQLKEIIEVQTELYYIDKYGMANIEVHLPSCKVKITPGKKYTKVDRGGSGMYMIDNETGVIYGIKAYGKVHKGHTYGTLVTIERFNWGGYKAVEREIA